MEAPTVANAEIDSNTMATNGMPTGVVSSRLKATMKMNAIDRSATDNARYTTSCGIRRPSASADGRPRTVETMAMRSTLKVFTLMPPAVEPDAPPMNIIAMTMNRVGSRSSTVGNVLKPGRPERRRFEQRIERPSALGQGAEGGGIGPLENGQRCGPDREDGQRRQHDDPRLEREPPPAPLGRDVADDGEAETAQEDEHAERREDKRVADEVRQAAVTAEQVEAPIVEGGDGVEDPPPGGLDRVGRVVANQERDGQDDGPRDLGDEGEDRNAPDDAGNATELRDTGRRLRQDPVT